ncbi:glycosyltransferase [Scleromatobacter humisilvae]|uniref:Glycosyltransferase n=1 Tax=Scleromatobacter humisilvae TaxID=2897159 RepID=A0A9X1YJR3_9BURK|nr:glycosyltransferase [Scleromatobacter humisilvae]MCK9686670.1 glycosyltransferase [Scleromatobacter humisilvae]
MAFHIAMPRRMSAQELAAVDANGDRPRIAMSMIAKDLGAVVHAPGEGAVSFADKLRAKLAGPESMWAMARDIAARAAPGDVVFCGSEAGGLQVAKACADSRARPRVGIFVHNLDRPRGRVALKLFGIRRHAGLLMACSELQTTFLRDYLGTDDAQVRFVWDHTDNAFFTPGPASPDKRRPLIVSVGLEQRDYRTLAAATADMDVDVKISGFSEDAAVLQQTFPDVLPDNMSRKFYAWTDLVQLYRDADVVVVSVRENKYAAGVQSLLEGMACGRPVVATATAGLKSYLDEDVVASFAPGDVAGLRAAIERTLADRPAAEARAARGLALATRRHGIDDYVARIVGDLRALQRA